MKNIKDIFLESKTSTRDVERYAKSWFVQCESYNEYAAMLKTIIKGMEEALNENIKYYKDQQKADTELFKEDIEDIIEDIKENL